MGAEGEDTEATGIIIGGWTTQTSQSCSLKWWCCICHAHLQPVRYGSPATRPELTSVIPHAPDSHLQLLLIHPEDVLHADKAAACWAGSEPILSARPQLALLPVGWGADGQTEP